ncbi:MAG: hypothetical protein JST23_11060 [Bacteroidetes bacterium]|nr:hypothetical protein [Bacteroidota bacterium]
MGNFCQNCISWTKVAKRVSGDNFGVCDNIGVAMNIAIDGKTCTSDEGTFWTEEFFGCIYHRENDGSLFGFDDIIDGDTGEVK